MNVMLQQKDITVNQHHSPSYELIKENIITREMYEKSLFERIDRRIEQINNLKRLKDEELSDEEFYKLVYKVYYIKYDKKSVLNVNVLSNHDLTIRLGVNSIEEFDQHKFYTIDEIYKLFRDKEILLDNINIEEFNEWYYKKIYNLERNEFLQVSDNEFGIIYSNMKNSLNSNYNKKITCRIRSVITKDKIIKDYKKLIDFTNQELMYLKNIDNELNVRQLTY